MYLSTFTQERLSALALPHTQHAAIAYYSIASAVSSLDISIYIPIHISALYENPLQCNCKLRWLTSFLSTVSQVLPATCATPSNLNGTEVDSLEQDQLVCGESPE